MVSLANVSQEQLHLPVIADKPASELAKLARRQRPKTAYSETIRIEWGKTIGSGQCVALAQARGFDIRAGAARNWPDAAKRLGYVVDTKPKVGSVLVTWESSAGTSSGHVAIVEEVHSDHIVVVEQNYIARTVSHRKILLIAPTIRVFIHPLDNA